MKLRKGSIVLARRGTSGSQVAEVVAVPKGQGVVTVRVWRSTTSVFGPEKTLPLRDVSEPPAGDARVKEVQKARRAQRKATVATPVKGKTAAAKKAAAKAPKPAKKSTAKKATKKPATK